MTTYFDKDVAMQAVLYAAKESKENSETEEYVDYISSKLEMENAL